MTLISMFIQRVNPFVIVLYALATVGLLSIAALLRVQEVTRAANTPKETA
ncbi:MAG: hypothetical protein HC933_05835 [Pleurocapsa sp. SU_196_0]|nr:hypothetical protein [Pleurocapsa sp. SU_196_0]